MPKFVPSSKLNPCVICDDVGGKCRTHSDNEIHLCMNFVDSPSGEIHNGFKCIGITKDNLWSQWKIDNSAEWSDQKKAEWEDRKRQRKQQIEKENQERKARSLSVVERDRLYREILGQLELHPSDRADLERRGFTEVEIELAGFKSVVRNQKLKSRISSALPGVNWDGSHLLCEEGYLCPVRDLDGLIVACQARLRSPKDGNRYRWLSSNNAVLHLFPDGSKEGELPITFLEPATNPSQIWLCEGVGAKPHLLKERLGVLVIGAAGGQFASSPIIFKEILELVSKRIDRKEIILSPDAGDVGNPSVMNRWHKTANFVKELGYSIKFAWWGQFTKEDCDIDELEDYSKIEYISPKCFFEFGSKPLEIKKPAEPAKQNKSTLEECRDSIRKYSLTRKVDVSVSKRFLDVTYPKSGLIFVLSPKFTGKTTSLKKVRADNLSSKVKTLLITHRISLGRAIAAELDLPWIDDYANAPTLTANDKYGLALCIDSLHPYGKSKFDFEQYSGATVILDEVEQLIWHILNSSTCRDKRVLILLSLTNLLNHVIDTGGRIIALDADLSDFSVNYLSEILGNKIKPYIIKNTFKVPTFPTTVYNASSPDIMLPKIRECIEKNEKILILSDGQRENSRWGTYNIEQQLKEEFPNKSIIRIDRPSLANVDSDSFRAMASNIALRNAIKNYDIVILSPSCNTGVSIELFDHFSAVFGVFNGVLSASDILQFLWRLRDVKVRRYIWVRELGFKIANGSIFRKEIESTKRAIIREHISTLAGILPEKVDLDSPIDPIHARAWANYAARINASKDRLRNHVYALLEAEGSEIELSEECRVKAELEILKSKDAELINQQSDPDLSEEIKNKAREEREKLQEIIEPLDRKVSEIQENCKADKEKNTKIKERSEKLHYEKIATANKLISEVEAESIRKKAGVKESERYALLRWDLEQKYLTDATPSLAEMDAKKWFSKIQLHYYLTHDKELLKWRDLKHLGKQLNPGRKLVEPLDIDRPMMLQDVYLMSGKVRLVEDLGILSLLNPEKRYTEESPEILAVANVCTERKEEIKRILGVSFGEGQKPIRIVNDVLGGAIGIRLTRKSEKRKKGEKRGKCYQYNPCVDNRQEIFAKWFERDGKKMEGMEPADKREILESVGTIAPTSPLLETLPPLETPAESGDTSHKNIDLKELVSPLNSKASDDVPVVDAVGDCASDEVRELATALPTIATYEDFVFTACNYADEDVEEAIAIQSPGVRQRCQAWLVQLDTVAMEWLARQLAICPSVDDFWNLVALSKLELEKIATVLRGCANQSLVTWWNQAMGNVDRELLVTI